MFATIESLLAACGLQPLQAELDGKVTIATLAAASNVGRPELLKYLKNCGVARLPDRQKIATAFAKAQRADESVDVSDAASTAMPDATPVGAAQQLGFDLVKASMELWAELPHAAEARAPHP